MEPMGRIIKNHSTHIEGLIKLSATLVGAFLSDFISNIIDLVI